MALEHRDYMQSPEGSSSFSSGSVFDLQSAWFKLVLLNLVIFLAWQPAPGIREFLASEFMVSGQSLANGHLWTPLTSAFFHMGFGHLFWNMIFLFLFARDLEVVYGGRNLLALYLFGALGAALGQLGLGALWGSADVPMLGASGAVMGIVIAATFFSPRRQIMVFPFWVLAALFVLMDLSGAVRAFAGTGAGGVAYGAHLGGAIAGALFKVLDLRPFSAHSPEAAVLGPGLVARLRRRIGTREIPLDDRVAPTPRPSPSVDRDREAMTARVDDVLRKIKRDGIDSLTDEERALLQDASERYRTTSGRHLRQSP
jgi:membrane associated rhomboid family serine protease